MWSPFYISLLFWYKTLWERAKWYLLLKFVWWAAMYLLQATCCCGMMRFSAQCSQPQWWSTMIHNRNVGTQKRFNCNKRIKWSPVYQTILISRICFTFIWCYTYSFNNLAQGRCLDLPQGIFILKSSSYVS